MSSCSYGVSLPGSSWIFRMAWNPCASALAAVSGVIAWPSSFWTLVILLFAIVAACAGVAVFARRSWYMRGRSTFRRSVPCWRTVPRFMVWALPEIFLPFTVRFGQFFVLPGLKSAGMPKSLRASVIAWYICV